MAYKKTQFGWFIIIILAIVLGALLLVYFLIAPDEMEQLTIAFPLGFGAIMLLVIMLFYQLSVEVNDQAIRLKFGIGLLHKTIPLDQLNGVTPVRNKWWYGLGIRFTPNGWLWNIYGLDAVEIAYKSGKRFRIGTAEPQALAQAIGNKIPAVA